MQISEHVHLEIKELCAEGDVFAEMGEFMKKMSEKMQSKDANADVNWKASVKDTGQKKVINGFNAHEMIMTITIT